MTLNIFNANGSFEWLCYFLSPYVPDELKKQIIIPNPKQWVEIVRVADAQMLLPKLYLNLKKFNLIDLLQDELKECLFLSYELNLDRNNRLYKQTINLVKALNEIGIKPILIKGIEVLIEELHHANGRMMNDIDIWVLERNRWKDIQKCFFKINYECEIDITTFDQEIEHHFPPFYNDNCPARIELHHRLIRPSLKDLISEEKIKERIIYKNKDGITYGVLNNIDSTALSYIQSTHMAVPNFSTAMVPAMKWLDFLNRTYDMKNDKKYFSRNDFDILGLDEDIDKEYFTALFYYFKFSYGGELNKTYIEKKDYVLKHPYKTEFKFLIKKISDKHSYNINRPFSSYVRFVKNLVQPNKKIWK